MYTRAGTFALDRDGVLVNPANGLRVQGWMATTDTTGEKVINSSGTVEDIVVPVYGKIPARETTNVRYKCNLDSKLPILPPDATGQMRASAGVTTNIDVYDNLGDPHRLTLNIWKTDTNQWTASAAITDTEGPVTLDIPAGANQANQENTSSRINLRFTPEGRLVSVADESSPDESNQGNLVANVNYRVAGDPSVRNIRLDLGSSGLVEGITQFSSPSTTKAVEQDGYSMGYMESFTIDNSGIITAVYTNGTKQAVGQVATAVFTNQQGLENAGENLYEVSNNSGLPNIGPAAEAGRGKVVAGTLEMSNVDLSEQFTDMIITQRGFQANSRTITTSDQMLQELINLKR